MFLPSARRVELEVHCDDDWWSHLGSTKNRPGIQRHLWFLSVESISVHHEVLCWNLRSLRLVPALEWILGIRSVFLTILVHHLQMGTWIQQLFVSRWFVEDKYLTHPTFPNLPGLLSKYLLSKFLPRSAHSQERFLFVLSCQIDEFLPDLSWSRMIFNHCSKSYDRPFEWFSKSSFIGRLPIGQEVLDVSQTAMAFHRVRPPPFIWSWL